jgi:hypothetical protein
MRLNYHAEDLTLQAMAVFAFTEKTDGTCGAIPSRMPTGLFRQGIDTNRELAKDTPSEIHAPPTPPREPLGAPVNTKVDDGRRGEDRQHR